jgi:methyl-accepting chemotaxis protein
LRRDEIGETAEAVNVLLTRVSDVLRSILQSSDSVAVASRQISAGNADLSSRTEEQAASLEETAATMTELTHTVRSNGDAASRAHKVAIDTARVAESGHQSVSRMVKTMSDIDESSTKISEITTIIEGIAFQTNILALNAAVEAARAGENGRGFAVVAGEVRTLAQRASASAREIKELVETSTANVLNGSQHAKEAGVVMDKVLRAIRDLSDIVSEIASGSSEQTLGIEQVNVAVGQMDEVTQQNAALVDRRQPLRTRCKSKQIFFAIASGRSACPPERRSERTSPGDGGRCSDGERVVDTPTANYRFAAFAYGRLVTTGLVHGKSQQDPFWFA